MVMRHENAANTIVVENGSVAEDASRRESNLQAQQQQQRQVEEQEQQEKQQNEQQQGQQDKAMKKQVTIEEESFLVGDDALSACLTRKNSRNVKRIGIIGYGHLGQFLRMELSKYPAFYAIRKIWNRTEEVKENVRPLSELELLSERRRSTTNGSVVHDDDEVDNDDREKRKAAEKHEEDPLDDVELVIEVAHPSVVKRYAKRILAHCDLFIGSVAALADAATLNVVEEALRENRHRRVFVPSAASFWGAEDIRCMARMGTLKNLTITIMKHPSSLRILGALNDLCKRALKTNFPVVVYDGPARLLCASAPSIANLVASTALAASNLGFDATRVKLIADPALSKWSIVEYEALGENGFRTTCRRESPAQPDTLSNEDNTYFSILSTIREAFYKPPGFNIC